MQKQKQLLLLIGVLCTLLSSQGNGGALAVIWPCESSADCTADGSSCDPDTSQCKCLGFDTVFSANYTQCLRTSLIGDACQDTVQCNLMPTGASCKKGVCDCADGQTYLSGKCRPLNGLNEPCEKDSDCYFGYDRDSVSCEEKVCACANGYYHRYGNICRRRSMEKDDACVVDKDCEELDANAACVSLKCTYADDTSTPASTETTPDESETTPQDNDTTETETETELNTITTEAEPSVSFVREKKYFTRAFIANTPTHRDAAAQASLTLINGDRELLLTPRRSREIAVQTSIDNYELELAELAPTVRDVGTTTVTVSNSGSAGSRRTSTHALNIQRRHLPAIFRFENEDVRTYSTLGSSRDDEEDKKYGSSCTENGKSCTGLPHSVCTNKICVCRQNYYARNGTCFAELGEIAESKDQCEHEFDKLTKICKCQKNYFYERDLRNCRKPIQYHLSCTSNSQCSPFGASFCHPQIPRRCTCEEYAQYNEITQMCEYKDGLGAECESNDGCIVDHSVCSNRICVCKDKFFEKDDLCIAGIGADCSDDEECMAEDSVCLEHSNSTKSKDLEAARTCQCRKGYVHFKDECLKEAEQLEEDCVEDEQCMPLLASCSTEGKCSCSSEQHAKNGVCVTKRLVNEPCSKATECFVEKEPETVECRNSVCQCKAGFQPSSTHRQCNRIPNKKNSSGRPSALKIITFALIGSAFLITSAAIKQAYY
ncbi:CG7381 [Drosophila busckii]|uniref:CG7381 n=1 Tax=Drosophila busckii TaxID=30019 RepID=A0A0M3QXI4_DROBS|nr:uncharacterized protein LOC108601778 [Drosophila busckii]ALC45929.1 CG7381 [Drosophila busckii]